MSVDSEEREIALLDAFGLMELQGSTDLMTKTEVIEATRSLGLSISDRTITYYVARANPAEGCPCGS